MVSYGKLDLESIRAYIAQDNPTAARRAATRIREAVDRLANFPLSSRTGRVSGTLELVIAGTAYIAAYRVQEGAVYIAAVLHGRQNWPESF